MSKDMFRQDTVAASGLYPPRVIICPGPEYSPAARRWQGIPTLERAADGRLWAAWYTGGDGEDPGNHVVLAGSGDEGESWLDPVLAVDPGPERRVFDPCLWHDPLGRLWLFWAQSGENTYYDGRGGVWAMRTDDASRDRPDWTEPFRLGDGVMMNKPLVTASGEWLLPAAIWDLKWDYMPPIKEELRDMAGPGVVVSKDEGRSWEWRGGVRESLRCNFHEHMLVERSDGSLWMLIRHTPELLQSESFDGGRTWSPPGPSGIKSPGSRFFIRRLASGALLLVNHHGFDGPSAPEARSRLTALLSDDDGRSWSDPGLLLDERGRVSYPDGVQASDGRIYIIYDFNRGDRWAQGNEREILMAVFTEDDVRHGAPGPGTRLCRLVSKVPDDVAHTAKENSGWKPKELRQE